MTRQKKTRKESRLLPKKSNSDKSSTITADGKKPKKKLGNKPGSRQHAQINTEREVQDNQPKDNRLGSKKPIALVKEEAVKTAKVKTKNAKQAIAAVHIVENDSSLDATEEFTISEQIERIEQDDQLQEIIAKQEAELALTEQEVDYFNELMEQHQRLSAQLDVDDEQNESLSEDDLWDKFDSSNLSDYHQE
jgi:ribosome assembly protein YihI (activator of Der GTPase)